jgi:hypothetical protein
MAGLNFDRVAQAAKAAQQGKAQAPQQGVAPVNGGVASYAQPGSNVAPLRQNGQRGPRMGADGKPLPDAQLYLNVVVTLPIPLENGEVQMTEIGLPFGLAIDTMSDSTNAGPTIDPVKNALRDIFKVLGEGLDPGETLIVDEHTCQVPFKLQLRRKGERAAATPENNPIMAALAGMLNAAPAA